MPSHVLLAAGRPLALDIPNPFSAGADEVIGWLVDGINKAINTFFGDLVKAALDPLLRLLGRTLLTTPAPSALPRVGVLWENSRQIAVAVYALIILLAGILVMAYETVQTRHSIKEIAPRLVLGFLAANLSLLLMGQVVAFANALSEGVMSDGVNPASAAGTLTALVMNSVTNGGIFMIFIGIALGCILLALLVCYVIRVVITVLLIACAPLALMCFALPQTEGIARWWCRAFAGVLTIQLAQSLTLIAALDVFLAPGGFTLFGPTPDGLVNVIVTLALLYILFKIPFWILHSIKIGNGKPSLLGRAVKAAIAYKTLGMLGAGKGATAVQRRPGVPPNARPGTAGPGRGRPGGPGGGVRPGGSGPSPAGPGGPNRPGGPRPRGAGGTRPAQSAGALRLAGSRQSTARIAVAPQPATRSTQQAHIDRPVTQRPSATSYPGSPTGAASMRHRPNLTRDSQASSSAPGSARGPGAIERPLGHDRPFARPTTARRTTVPVARPPANDRTRPVSPPVARASNPVRRPMPVVPPITVSSRVRLRPTAPPALLKSGHETAER